MALIPNADQNAPAAPPADDQPSPATGPSASGPAGVQPSTQAPGGGQGTAPQAAPNTPEQKAYETAIASVMQMLFKRGAIENIIHAVIGSQDLGDAVALQVSHILQAVDHHNAQMPLPALVQVAVDSIGIIGQMLQAAGRPMSGQDVVTAIQSLITHYMQLGGSTQQQIQATLSQINPQQLAQLIDQEMQAFNAKGGGQPPEGESDPEDNPAQGGDGGADEASEGEGDEEESEDQNDSAGLSKQVGAAGGDGEEEEE